MRVCGVLKCDYCGEMLKDMRWHQLEKHACTNHGCLIAYARYIDQQIKKLTNKIFELKQIEDQVRCSMASTK